MQLFKGFFVVLAGLFIFITILSLLIPSKMMITRAVVINAKADKVFSEISDFRKWKHWQPVFISDSNLFRFDTTADGKSNSCEWNSKGRINKMFITGKADNTVNIRLASTGENDVLNTIRVLPLADSMQVQTEWTVLIKLKWYPWEKFYGVFIEKVSGQGYEDALNSLKAYAENH